MKTLACPERPKIRLVSDFVDYYDHLFDSPGADLVLERKSNSVLSRREMFEYLSRKIGPHMVPIYGTPQEVYERCVETWGNLRGSFKHILSVVVYLDGRTHHGEDKILVPLGEALEKYPDHLVAEYIPSTPSRLGVSLRYLQVGDKIFWLKYSSADDWRSNCGNVEISVLSQERDGYHPRIALPLFAVDFVWAHRLYAIDFNIAPRLQGTGVENLLSAKDAAEAIMRSVTAQVPAKERGA